MALTTYSLDLFVGWENFGGQEIEGGMGEGKGGEALRGLRHQRTSSTLSPVTWSSNWASDGQHAQGFQKVCFCLNHGRF